MTLDQIIKIQSIIDNRAIRSDTLEFLDKKRYSKSKDEWIRYGDMHFDHFVSVIGTAILVEPATRRPLDIVQRIGDLFHRVFMKVIKLEEDRSFSGL